MNKMTTIVTDDCFRAAYLMLYGRYKETRFENGQYRYVIEGEAYILAVQNYCFCTGTARVDPLVLREAVRFLKELSRSDEIELTELSEPFVIDLEEEEGE